MQLEMTKDNNDSDMDRIIKEKDSLKEENEHLEKQVKDKEQQVRKLVND